MKIGYVLTAALFLFICTTSNAAEFRGLIEPYKTVKIGSPSEGIIAEVNVDRGDFVKKGQTVATLEAGVERATMKAKEASKEYLAQKKERIEKIYKKEFASKSEMDEAEANRAVSEMQLKEAAEVVKRRLVTSPIDGIVVERFLNPGEYVKDQPLIKVAKINPLNVEVIIPTQYFTSIKVGMRAKVIPEDPIGGEYTAVVKIVDRVIDAASGTFGVRLQLPNPGNRLPSGLKCKVIFP